MGSDTLAKAESSTAVVAVPVLPGDTIPHIARPATTRNEAIDVVRLIAAAAIVYIHAVHYPTLNASRNLFRFAVPFYLFASFYYQSLSLRRKSDRTLLGYIAARFRRLYLPFLAWSVIYLIARDVKRVKLAGSGLVKLQPGLLWRGIEYHLWFLPYLLGFSIILAVAHWTLLKRDRRWRWPLILLAIAAGFYFSFKPMPAWNEVFDNPTYAYVQYWRATPAACWGLAFAWFMTMGPELYVIPMAVGMAGIVLTVICSIWQAVYDIQPIPRFNRPRHFPGRAGAVEGVDRARSGAVGPMELWDLPVSRPNR